MWGWLSKLWGGINSLVSSPAAGAAIGYAGQQQTNAANAAQAKAQMDFQERMRATQYQTTVADLTKAGLNPALAYSQGGAGNLGGSAATMGNSAASGISSAQAALSMKQQLANTQLTQAQARDTNASADLKDSEVRARSASAVEGGENRPPLNYYQAAQIARYKAEELGLKLTEEQFKGLVQQVYNQNRATAASAAQTETMTKILSPQAKWKGNKYQPYLEGMKDVLDLGTSAAGIAGRIYR